jgi:hypothetical protein
METLCGGDALRVVPNAKETFVCLGLKLINTFIITPIKQMPVP